MRILLVKDEPKAAQILAKGLRNEGYAVGVANEAEDALYKSGQLGNAGRNTLIRPGLYDLDMSLIKRSTLRTTRILPFQRATMAETSAVFADRCAEWDSRTGHSNDDSDSAATGRAEDCLLAKTLYSSASSKSKKARMLDSQIIVANVGLRQLS